MKRLTEADIRRIFNEVIEARFFRNGTIQAPEVHIHVVGGDPIQSAQEAAQYIRAYRDL